MNTQVFRSNLQYKVPIENIIAVSCTNNAYEGNRQFCNGKIYNSNFRT